MATFADDVCKISFTGTRTGGEIWSTGLWCTMLPNGSLTQAELDSFVNSVDGLWATAWGAMAGFISTATNNNKVRASLYAAGSTTAFLQSEKTVSRSGSASSGLHPYEVALVASLRTATPTRSGRGRMYLPCDAVTMAATGQYSNTQPPTASSAIAAMITGINALTVGGTTNPEVVVASWTQGIARPVTTVVVDTLPDIQRRRGDSLVAAGVTTTAV